MTAMINAAHDPRIGEVVANGQYRVLERLGHGGFGTVYLVETVVGGLRRALKVLHAHWAADAAACRRFVNEAVVLEQLNHPNIARCYSAGTLEGGAPYLLLEFVKGQPLRDLPGANARPLPPVRAVRLAKQIASGLVVVHANHVLHRDLTPQNVLIVGAGSASEHVKLVDFGIAQALDDRTQSGVTTFGTPLFMAPEQLDAATELDGRADLWQLGVLLYWMLTGALPYEPQEVTLANLCALHRQFPAAGPSPADAHGVLLAAPDLNRLVSRLLASDRHHRPTTALEVCEELARIEHLLTPQLAGDPALAFLDALCSQPGGSGWSAICRFLSGQPDQARLAAAANARLAEWPDDVRRAPLRWWDDAKRGAPPAAWSVARRLDLSGHGLDDQDAAALAATASLATITELILAHNQIGAAGAAALARSPHLRALSMLDLSDNRVGSAGAAELAAAAGLPSLATLNLSANGVGARGAAALAGGRLSLQSLDLGDNDVRTDGAAALAGGPALGSLQVLNLRDNAIGSDGASSIAVSPTLSALTSLDLSGNGIGAGGAAALAWSATMSRLTRLSLARNRLGLDGVELLVAPNRLGLLTALDLSSNEIGARGAMAVAGAPFARRLKELRVADNRLGDAGLAALLGGPYLSGVRRLDLGQNGITASGLALFSSAPLELTALSLAANPLGADGAIVLGHALSRLCLTELDVSDSQLTAGALTDLIAAAPPRLAWLSVAGNLLDQPVTQAAAAPSPALQYLDVSRCRLGAGGVSALLGLGFVRHLEVLLADGNDIGDDGMVAVARTLRELPGLARLQLRDNGLTARLFTTLAAAAVSARLVALDVAENQIGDDIASLVSAPDDWHRLQQLNLADNTVSFAAATAVWSAPALPDLHDASFARNALRGLVDLHSLARHKVSLLEDSFATLVPQLADVASRFYETLFERYPSVKPLFSRTSMRNQQQHLAAALTLVIDHLRSPDTAITHLRALGARHVGHGVQPSHYSAVAGILLETLRAASGGGWSDDLEAAWHDGLQAICAAMMQERHRDREPSAR
ncbi:MAG: protein kinase [Vicinamibacterales bacterium]